MKSLIDILKNCPSGMELDCTLCENVFFDKVDEYAIYPIILYHDNNGCRNTLCLTEDGKFNFRPGYKCVIFPKGKTSWDDFVPPCKFKDGDIIIDIYNNFCIYKGEGKYKDTNDFYVAYRNGDKTIIIQNNGGHFGSTNEFHLANEDEKKKFVSILERYYYRWNEETKTLDRITHFNIGDRVRFKSCHERSGTITDIKNDSYYVLGNSKVGAFSISNQHEWEIMPNTFDFSTLKPFEKVLVRKNGQAWQISFFGFINKSNTFTCLNGNVFPQCVPYYGNESLLGTLNECDEYFKIK